MLFTSVLLSLLAWCRADTFEVIEPSQPFTDAEFEALSSSNPSQVTAIFSTGVSTEGTIAKRSAVVIRGLSALWKYNCPIDGHQSRTFQWKATMFVNKAKLQLDPILHIDNFDGISITRHNDWWSAYYGQFCVVIGKKRCTYSFKGFIEGAIILPTGLAMSMVTDGTDTGELPKVEEYCIENDHHLRVNTCAATHGVACTVTNVKVDVLPHP